MSPHATCTIGTALLTLNAAGCDSVTTLHLTINECPRTEITACDSFSWNGITYTSTGVYTNGLDTLDLTINHSSSAVEAVTACNSLTWHGTTYTSSTTSPTFTCLNVDGCDSITTLHLTINHCSTTEVTACDSYTYNGVSYTTSGVYVDGTDTLALTINNTYQSTESISSCDDYYWRGATLTMAGIYHDTVFATVNDECDSVYHLDLTLNHSSFAEESATACDEYTWHGMTLTASTDDTSVTLQNAAGCDSTVTLHLTINHSVQQMLDTTVEGNLTWHGTTYTESGTYSWTGQTIYGCDSTVVLNLTVISVQSIDAVTESMVTVMPNPTNGIVTIKGVIVNAIEVFNINGDLLQTIMHSNSVDISSYPAGVYSLRITHPSGTLIRKIIKR